jgi:hypothetical protein
MQALVSRDEWPIELLKITPVRTTSKQLMEDAGKRLMSFAQTMTLPFLLMWLWYQTFWISENIAFSWMMKKQWLYFLNFT